MVFEDKSLIFNDLDGLLNYQGYQVEIVDTSPLVHFLKVFTQGVTKIGTATLRV